MAQDYQTRLLPSVHLRPIDFFAGLSGLLVSLYLIVIVAINA